MQGRWGDGVSKESALDYLRAALNRLGEHAHSYNVPVLYEPLNRYETNLLTTIGETTAFLKTLATDNVKILADLFHMNIEEANSAAAIGEARGFIGHVHFVDSNRRPAGNGHIDYKPIAQALRDIGYTGYLSAEAQAYPDSKMAAAQTIKVFNEHFR